MINLRRPLPPVRGWILQQIVKLAAVAASPADVVLVVDSDVAFIRPFTAETFYRDGTVRFYRKPREITGRLPKHLLWHQAARRLLGLQPGDPPFTDYIAAMMAWSPQATRQMLDRVSSIAGQHWTTAIARRLHFSESTLYGVFVDEVLGAPAFVSDDPLCHAHWAEGPLDHGSALDFIRRVRPTDVAAMISSKSETPLAVRRAALKAHRSIVPFPLGAPAET